MQTDIRDLEVTRKLRALGEVRVTDWDFNDVLPAVRQLASREVDIEGFIRHAANYRVFEWGTSKATQNGPPEISKCASAEDIESSILRAKAFLQYLILQLCENPESVEIRLREFQPLKACLVLTMPHREASAIIGHGGYTAAAIRGLVQDLARRSGHTLDFKITTLEELIPKRMNSKQSKPDAREVIPDAPKKRKSKQDGNQRQNRKKNRKTAVWDDDS